MGKYRVQQGECLASIAKKCGFPDYKKIYDHPSNAAFRKKRPNPNHIYPGDELYIPDLEERVESRSADTLHQFKRKGSTVLLRLLLKDPDEKPLANIKFKLDVGEVVIEDMTDGQGMLEVKVPADAESGLLIVWADSDDEEKIYTRIVRVGHLDPISEIEGVQARLNNLGFACGAVDGIAGEKTKAALMGFQHSVGLTVTGEVDDDTLDKLEDAHDGT